ncbi:MAG: transcriptional repressor LexA [candidate division Zixibacteria bacterium]|nr:transcriptional repressor LexA [candidate division Zixibacteria bacterium]
MTENKLELTRRQQDIYEFVRDIIHTDGRPPTMREIGERFGIKSTNGVREALAVLERKGYIKRAPYLSRGIELVEEVPTNVMPIPVVGRVAAGLPLLAVENIDGHVAVDQSFLPSGEVFSLRVTGESMRDEGIKDGDLVLVKKQDSAYKGDIVVAVIGEEATVKKFYPDRGRVRLEPANPEFGPIIVDKNAPGFFIAGKVVGLLRRM